MRIILTKLGFTILITVTNFKIHKIKLSLFLSYLNIKNILKINENFYPKDPNESNSQFHHYKIMVNTASALCIRSNLNFLFQQNSLRTEDDIPLIWFLKRKLVKCVMTDKVFITISRFTYEDPTDLKSRIHVIDQMIQEVMFVEVENLDKKLIATFKGKSSPDQVEDQTLKELLILQNFDFSELMFKDFQKYVIEAKKQKFHSEKLKLPDLYQATFLKSNIEKIATLDENFKNLEITIFGWNTEVSKILAEEEARTAPIAATNTTFTSKKLASVDAFGSSLRHVDELLTKRYKYAIRKAPAHGPHMINRYAMYELQKNFEQEYFQTSANQIRGSNDMQMAFAYYYYILNEPAQVLITELFDKCDIDKNGILSDYELRILYARSRNKLPITHIDIEEMTSEIKLCAQEMNILDKSFTLIKNLHHTHKSFLSKLKFWASESHEEQYQNSGLGAKGATYMNHNFYAHGQKYRDPNMPQINYNFAVQCPYILNLFKDLDGSSSDLKFQASIIKEYQSTEVPADDIEFVEVTSSNTTLQSHFDQVIKNHKLFLCIQDALDPADTPEIYNSNQQIYKFLNNFYENLYPIPSQFENKNGKLNKFYHYDAMQRFLFWENLCKNVVNFVKEVVCLLLVYLFFRKFIRKRLRFR